MRENPQDLEPKTKAFALRVTRVRSSVVLLGVLASLVCTVGDARGAEAPPRVIVLTDISNEPDDEESLVRSLILELRDNGTPNLFAYRRAITQIDP